MNPEYYEGIVIITIERLLKQGRTCGLRTLVKETGLGNVTILKAIDRLHTKKRLNVIRKGQGILTRYEILDPPGMFDRLAYSLHLESKNGS